MGPTLGNGLAKGKPFFSDSGFASQRRGGNWVMSGARILYVEDNFDNRLLVRRVLEVEGFSVAEAMDGPSGLEKAKESPPDLILLDINLPDIDGYELAGRFRQLPSLKGVPIIAVTANVMKGDRERVLAAGCDGYIPKPIDVDKLPEQVRAALSKA